jgi:hypothetical protein
MNRDDIVKLAREAGMAQEFHGVFPSMERFAAFVEKHAIAASMPAIKLSMQAEREACADICDQHASIEGIAQRCAAEIRARSHS